MKCGTWIGSFALVLGCLPLFESALQAELVAHWKLDEGTGSTFRDSAGVSDGYLLQGTVPQWSTDVPPTTFENPFSLQFDAAGRSYVQTSFEGIGGDGARTISAWVKTESTAGQAIVAYGARDGNGRKWHFRINPDGDPRVPGAVRTEAQGGNQTGDTDLSDGDWHHVVSVFPGGPGADNVDVIHYVDGIMEAETGTTDEPIDTGIGDPFPLVSIGARQQTPPNFENFMNGWIDDVRMYDRELTEAEIQSLTSNPTADSLVAHWAFDDGPGSAAASEKVAGNDGVLTSASSVSVEWITDGPPVQDNAVRFSGNSSWIQTDFEGIGGNDPRTVTFWMRSDVADDGPTHGIVGWGASNPTEKFHIRVNNNAGNGELGAIRTEVEGGQNVATTPINDGDWHHIAVVFPEGAEFNSEVLHYVDGEFDEQSGGGDQIVDTLIGPGAEPVTLGMRLQGAARHFFPGDLADVRIYDEALDLDAIRAIMAGEGLGGEPGDFDGDGVLGVNDIELLSQAVRDQTHPSRFDLNNDQLVDDDDRTVWVKELKGTWFGDANLDGVFTSRDFVEVFQTGKFEKDVPATWAEGDWQGDGEFTTSDFVKAFQDGGFERGPLGAARAVPEPVSVHLLWLALPLLAARMRRPRR